MPKSKRWQKLRAAMSLLWGWIMAMKRLWVVLAGTFLADAPVFPVSSATGEGLEALRAALTALAGSLAPRPRSDIFRLPVDRAFSMKGHGTVVTGTVISGREAQELGLIDRVGTLSDALEELYGMISLSRS